MQRAALSARGVRVRLRRRVREHVAANGTRRPLPGARVRRVLCLQVLSGARSSSLLSDDKQYLRNRNISRSIDYTLQTSAMAAAYVYSGHLLLPYQLLLPLVACAVGVLCMYVLERLAGARLLPAADGECENLEQASGESYGVVHSVAANK